MSSKKVKMSPSNDTEEELLWSKIEDYIRSCPHVAGASHPAIQGALKGMEHERKRLERDAKLQQKFAATTTNTSTANDTANTIASVANESSQNNTTMKTNNDNTNATRMNDEDDDMLTDDWHDVNADQKAAEVLPVDGGDSETSFLGDRLASEAVLLIARHNVAVSSPVAALAAAFHGALLSSSSSNGASGSSSSRSSSLGFVCTGVPEEGPSNGFAKPIRPLAPGTFLPLNWDKNKNRIVLRYRQDGVGGSVGSVVLTVELQAMNNNNISSDSAEIKVTWTPSKQAASSGEPTLTFALGDHINLDSWNHASQNSTVKVAPSLHYKSLASLMTRWVQTCDLGDSMVQDDSGVATKEEQQHQQKLYVDATIQQLPSQQQQRTALPASVRSEPQPVLPQYTGGLPSITTGPRGYEVPSTLQDAFPGAHRGGLSVPGQFSGDLFPGAPGSGGNLMGPNHPAFGGGGGPLDSGSYLQPRHDPYGPPPTHPEHNGVPGPGFAPRGPPRRQLGGTPNNDHLRPPNNLNNNMFM